MKSAVIIEEEEEQEEKGGAGRDGGDEGASGRTAGGRTSADAETDTNTETTTTATVIVTFDQDLRSTPKPTLGQFTLNYTNTDGTTGTIAVTGVSISGKVLTLTLATAPEDGQTLTLDYTHKDDTPLKRAAPGGDNVPSFTGRAVLPLPVIYSDPPTIAANLIAESRQNLRSTTLISTLGQGVSAGGGNISNDQAQGFTTGPVDRAGSFYRVTSVQIRLSANAGTDPTYSVRICPEFNGKPSNACLGTLTNPALPTGVQARFTATFTAPGAGVQLDGGTNYFVVWNTVTLGSRTMQLLVTASNTEDRDRAAGWSIADSAWERGRSDTAWNTSQDDTRLIAENGYQYAPGSDYDTDDDGLIEISNKAQLNAIRWDTDGDGIVAPSNLSNYNADFSGAASDMGCPDAACIGYEIGSGAADEEAIAIDLTGVSWASISGFGTTLEGNGNTIHKLTMLKGGTTNNTGLFHNINPTGVVRNLGLTDVNVRAQQNVGVVAMENHGLIYNVYSTGSVTAMATASAGIASDAGGLVGYVFTGGKIYASHSSASVRGSSPGTVKNIGGLVGHIDASGEIKASYAAGGVTAQTATTQQNIGGLAGSLASGSIIQASYSVATVTAGSVATNVGGLVGSNSGTVTASYYDSGTSGRNDTGKGAPKTTAELKAPTGYSGIYADWNLTLNGQSNPWRFPAGDYPDLGLRETTDYDTDDDGLIEVFNPAQLNAIRWDANGNGFVDVGEDYADYLAAFPNLRPGMGCPASGCTGYEIGTGAEGEAPIVIDLTGTSWTSGIGTSASGFTATLEGHHNTIHKLTVLKDGATDNAGLFENITATGAVRNLGLTDVNVRAKASVGALAGDNRGLISNTSRVASLPRLRLLAQLPVRRAGWWASTGTTARYTSAIRRPA